MLLCEADGTLFPSEESVHEASTAVVNLCLTRLGIEHAYEPRELCQLANGRNFRSLARLLATLHDRRLDEDDLDAWVATERDVVTAHLRTVLRPDPEVTFPLARLARSVPLAVVSSSATERVRTCLEVTELSRFFGRDRIFSAESSLPVPAGKPDPAVYSLACDRLGVDPADAVAVEGSVNGVRSATAAGCWTIGTLQFTPVDERPARAAALRAAGAAVVLDDWREIARFLPDPPLHGRPILTRSA